MFQCLVVGRMPTHANTPHKSPEHVNVLYERGGSCTSVQLCISGTGGKQGTSRRIHDGSYRVVYWVGLRQLNLIPCFSF